MTVLITHERGRPPARHLLESLGLLPYAAHEFQAGDGTIRAAYRTASPFAEWSDYQRDLARLLLTRESGIKGVNFPGEGE